MAPPLTDNEIYEQAAKRVKEKKDFYTHLIVYVVVNAFLIVIWALTSFGYPWFVWVLSGWGVGLSIHAANVFLVDRGGLSERRAIEKEAERMRRDGR